MDRLWPGLVLALLAAACTERQAATLVPDLLKRALAVPATASEPLYAYDFEDRIEGGTKEEQSTSIVRGHVDPSREKGDRVTISFVQQTGERPTDPERQDARYERDARGLTWCDTLSREDVTNAVDKGAASGGRLFSFTPKPESDGNDQLRDMMEKMAGEAVVDEASATLRSFSAKLTRPQNIMLVAEMKTASIKAECALAPDGRAYATQMEFDFSGSGFGQSFGIRSMQTVSNVTPAG